VLASSKRCEPFSAPRGQLPGQTANGASRGVWRDSGAALQPLGGSSAPVGW
jgi:hypothetical protein